MTIELLVGAGGLAAAIALVGWTHVRQQAAVERLDDRVAHLLAAVSLLTDTMEGGLRDVAVEVARQGSTAAAPKPRSRAVAQRRVATAARRGRSVAEIAAAEEVSEGEVRLRLNMERSQKERAGHAAVR